MNKNLIIVGAGGLLALAAVLVVLTSSSSVDIDPGDLNLENEPVVIKKTKVFEAKEIDYERAKPAAQAKPAQAPAQAVVEKKPEKPLPLGTRTYDSKRQYSVALYDPERMYKPSEAPKAESYTKVEGRLDGNAFVINVPDYFLEKPESVMLRITNLKTKETKTVPASFLHDVYASNMNDSAAAPSHKKISISSDNPEAYSYDEQPQITPPSFQ